MHGACTSVLGVQRGDLYRLPLETARFCISCGAILAIVMLGGRTRGRCPACGWLWLGLPSPVVLVLAVSPSGRVVLTRDSRFPTDRWGLVAGYIERDEAAEVAALPEAREEAGVEGSAARVVGSDRHGNNVMFCVRLVPA